MVSTCAELGAVDQARGLAGEDHVVEFRICREARPVEVGFDEEFFCAHLIRFANCARAFAMNLPGRTCAA